MKQEKQQILVSEEIEPVNVIFFLLTDDLHDFEVVFSFSVDKLIN